MATTSNAASDYLEQSALEHFGYSSYSKARLKFALFYSDPDDNTGYELDSSNDLDIPSAAFRLDERPSIGLTASTTGGPTSTVTLPLPVTG